MRTEATKEAELPEDTAARLEVIIDREAEPGDVLPALARLLRRLRDREQREGHGPPVDAGERDRAG